MARRVLFIMAMDATWFAVGGPDGSAQAPAHAFDLLMEEVTLMTQAKAAVAAETLQPFQAPPALPVRGTPDTSQPGIMSASP